MFGDIEADIDFANSGNSVIRVRIQSNDVTVDTSVRVVITATTMAQVVSSGNDWTYLVPGVVDDVDPNIGQNGTVVTVTGEPDVQTSGETLGILIRLKTTNYWAFLPHRIFL